MKERVVNSCALALFDVNKQTRDCSRRLAKLCCPTSLFATFFSSFCNVHLTTLRTWLRRCFEVSVKTGVRRAHTAAYVGFTPAPVFQAFRKSCRIMVGRGLCLRIGVERNQQQSEVGRMFVVNLQQQQTVCCSLASSCDPSCFSLPHHCLNVDLRPQPCVGLC